MTTYNGAIDARAEVFVQIDVTKTDMFLWMVDKNLSRTDSLLSQSHLIHEIDKTVNSVLPNIVNHAHGLEPLTEKALLWLDEYWEDIDESR